MAFTLERFSHRLLAHEREVVRNELLSRLGPTTAFRSYFERALYGEEHPYAKRDYPFSDVAAIELDDARWFFQQGYRPSNARLVIVGDMNTSRARAQIEKYFAPVVEPRLPRARRSSRRQPVAATAHLRFEHPTYREEFLMGWPLPAPAAPERAAAEVLVHLLETRLQNLLVHELRDLAELDLDIVDRELGSLLVLEGFLTENTKPEDVESALLRA